MTKGVSIHIEKRKKNKKGFYKRASTLVNSKGKFNKVFNSRGTFRLRINEWKTHYDLDSDSKSGSYAVVNDIWGGTKRLTFDKDGYTETFYAKEGYSIFVRANLVKKKFRVKGHVFEDTNRNGLWDRGEPPIEGAQVILSRKQGKAIRTTDRNGKYEFEKETTDSAYTVTVKVDDDKYSFTKKLNTKYDSRTNDSDVDADGKRRHFSVRSGQVIEIDAGVVKKTSPTKPPSSASPTLDREFCSRRRRVEEKDDELRGYGKITWADFLKVKPESDPYAAHISTGLQWFICIRTKYDDKHGYKSTVESRASAIMNKSKSSAKNSVRRDALLLAHEQLHFDIADLYARKLMKKLDALVGTGATPEAARADLQRKVKAVEDATIAEHRKIQADYDRETAHNTNGAKQAEWEKKIKSARH